MVRQTPGVSRRSPCSDVVSISERLRLSSGQHAYGSAASGNQVPQASNQRWRRPRVHPLPGVPALSTQKRLILISFVNHLAFRGAHMRICDAKDCKTGSWTI